jgi:hypothetical protein
VLRRTEWSCVTEGGIVVHRYRERNGFAQGIEFLVHMVIKV